ncbi:response regulator transcription factor [bacterium]|nr:response regulator transcription factor [bacterium]
MKILLIEDDTNLATSLMESLKEEGFLTESSHNGLSGIKMALVNNYDIVITDLNLPDENGENVCRAIRSKKQTPILVLTGELDTEIKIKLLNIGADDYLTKPFSLKELVARINAILRRSPQLEKENIKINQLVIERNNKKVFYKKQEVCLTNKEYLLLEILAINKGKIISRAEIFDKSWDSNVDIFSNAIETHISNIRKKIDKNIIKTVSGRGYTIN